MFFFPFLPVVKDPKAANATFAGPETLLAAYRPALSTLLEYNSRVVNTALQLNREWLAFVGRRIEHDIDTSRRLLACRNFQDMVEVYKDAFQIAQKEYQEEFEDLTRMSQTSAAETAQAVRMRIDEAQRDMHH